MIDGIPIMYGYNMAPMVKHYELRGTLTPSERDVILDALNNYISKLNSTDCDWSKELREDRDVFVRRTEELIGKFEKMKFD